MEAGAREKCGRRGVSGQVKIEGADEKCVLGKRQMPRYVP
jgi:hypothetical protein